MLDEYDFRNGVRGKYVKRFERKCDNCGKIGAIQKRITRIYGRGQNALVIENVPIISCPHCGASYLESVRKLTFTAGVFKRGESMFTQKWRCSLLLRAPSVEGHDDYFKNVVFFHFLTYYALVIILNLYFICYNLCNSQLGDDAPRHDAQIKRDDTPQDETLERFPTFPGAERRF
jgi:YgiT-type zinc finger domain-containing protein